METKPFWQTSEFWVIAFSNLATIISLLADALPAKYGVPLMGMMNAFYAIARGIAKSGNPVPPAPSTVVITETITPPVKG